MLPPEAIREPVPLHQAQVRMLHMVIVRHGPESCPGRPGNDAIHPFGHTTTEIRPVPSMD